MNSYFNATLNPTGKTGIGTVVVSVFNGVMGELTNYPVGESTGWLSHKILMHKANNIAQTFAMGDARAHNNHVRKTAIPENARIAALKTGLELQQDQTAWVVG